MAQYCVAKDEVEQGLGEYIFRAVCGCQELYIISYTL
jgi:hypothetical protein